MRYGSPTAFCRTISNAESENAAFRERRIADAVNKGPRLRLGPLTATHFLVFKFSMNFARLTYRSARLQQRPMLTNTFGLARARFRYARIGSKLSALTTAILNRDGKCSAP
ncbi:MAG: hypothetical protein C4325_06225 [Blastocatellia bacterium]